MPLLWGCVLAPTSPEQGTESQDVWVLSQLLEGSGDPMDWSRGHWELEYLGLIHSSGRGVWWVARTPGFHPGLGKEGRG